MHKGLHMRVLIPIETGLGNAILMTSMVRSLKKFDSSIEIDLVGGGKVGYARTFSA